MEEPQRFDDTTLNNNIAKELIWRRNSPYFYQTLYTQQLEWPSLAVEWWIDEYSSANKKSKNDEYELCYVTYGTYTNGGEKNYLVMAKVYMPNQEYLKKHQSTYIQIQNLKSQTKLSKRTIIVCKIKFKFYTRSNMMEKLLK